LSQTLGVLTSGSHDIQSEKEGSPMMMGAQWKVVDGGLQMVVSLSEALC